MTDLIACLSTGKGTWVEVSKLIKADNWDKVYLITNEFGKDKFNATDGKDVEYIIVDNRAPASEIKEKIISALKDKITNEVAVNFVSGAGNEHMGLLAALIKLGIGLRLVEPKDNAGLIEL